MNKPLTILKTVEDVDKAPYGTVVETASEAVFTIVSKSTKDYVRGNLPARVLRWGKNHYPAKFEQVIKTLADMTAEEHRLCQWMQCDVPYEGSCVILRVQDEFALVISKKGNLWDVSLSNVIPRFDLPRMVWPGEEPQEPPVVSEWVGRELRTAQDFRDAPEGTVAIDSYSGDRSLAVKNGPGLWDYETDEYTEFDLAEMDLVAPFTVVAVVEL